MSNEQSKSLETTTYSKYRSEVSIDIESTIAELRCQPILFIGSGLSKRYFGGPSWPELLSHLADKCPGIPHEYAYYRQKTDDLSEIGGLFSEKYRDWAWTDEGKNLFPKSLFATGVAADSYIKHKVCEHLKKITPKDTTKIKNASYKNEIESFKKVQPHAIITTNYDTFLEAIFVDYQSVIGQQILKTNYVSVGEIFKIHGCVSDSNSLVFTKSDYDLWLERKKYLSAKLLVYFAEHPLLLVGYGASDRNVRTILSDIDEILTSEGKVANNIYFLNYNPDAELSTDLPRERLLQLDAGRSFRVKNIDASSFTWVFDAFASGSPIESVNPKVLRSLLARNYQLVRYDIPRRTVDVNFQTLERVANENGVLANLLGISTLDNPSVFNAVYPFTITQLAERIGVSHWSRVNTLIGEIEQVHGLNIKNFDNIYHITVKTGKAEGSRTNKFSEACVDLLDKVNRGKPYVLDSKILSGPLAE